MWVEDNRDDLINKKKNKKLKPEIPYGWDHFLLRVDLNELESVLKNQSITHPYDVARALGLNCVIRNGLVHAIPTISEITYEEFSGDQS